jgi:predicted DNA-binding transcriptional regulator AlpA
MNTRSANPWEADCVPPQDCFLREPAVLKLVGVSKMTLRRWEEADLFPKRYQIGPNIVAWRESEVLRWIASREPVATRLCSKEAV